MFGRSSSRALSLALVLVLLLSTSVVAAAAFGTVQLADAQAGALTEATISFRLGASLSEQAADSINLIFDNRFTLPAAISAANVSVNGAAAKAVAVESNSGRVRITVPHDLAGGQTVTVMLGPAAGLHNPQSAGKYDLGVYTSQDSDVLWLACEITGRSLADLRVSADPDSAGAQAAYTIRFTAPANLAAGSDTVKIVFPSGAVVPRSIDGKWIVLNNYRVASVPAVSGRTLSFPIPVAVGAGKEVTVAIDQAAGIQNPGAAGSYPLGVQTSKDAGSEAWYQVSTGISQPGVAIEPSVAGLAAAYTISFSTGPTGSLIGGKDQISIKFPGGASLPATIPAGSVKVNGLPVNIGSVVKQGNNVISFHLPSQVNIGNQRSVAVSIDSSAGIKNPEAGTYTLAVSTTADPALIASRAFTIIEGSVSQPSVTVETDTAYAESRYAISFSTGGQGVLVGGQDTITVEFPEDTGVPAKLPTSLVKVNGTALNVGSVARSGSSITFTVPARVNIGASRAATVVIEGITNPGPGKYTLSVSTSADPNPVSSARYVIAGGAVKELAADVQPPVIGEPAEYRLSFKTSAGGALEGDEDTISVTFPRGTTLPTAISKNDISVNGAALTSKPSVSVSGRTVTMRVPAKASVGSNRPVTVIFSGEAGIVNPKSPGDYRLDLATSRDTAAQSSAPYGIYGGSVDSLTVGLSASGQGAAAAYEIGFRTSAGGALTGGEDSIFLTFPQGTVISEALLAGHLAVNGAAPERGGVTLDGRTVAVRLPKGLNVKSKAAVTVAISAAAGIKNPPVSGYYALTAATSKDPVGSQSDPYAIKKEQTIRIRIDDRTALVDGRQLIMEVPPTLMYSRTMVPLRFIGDAFGARTDYNDKTKGITITLEGTVIRLTVNSKTAMIGPGTVTLDAPATVVNGRTLVPTRFISEAFGAQVDWLPETRTVVITR